MIRRGILLLALVAAGCGKHKNCGDGSVAVPSDDPDGGVQCVPEGDGDGGDDGPHLPPPDGHSDARVDGPPGGFCGDGICNATETCSNCSTDCGQCPFCGDGICNNGETCATCSTDCFCPPDAAPPDAPVNCPPAQTISSTVTTTTVSGEPSCSTASCGTGSQNSPDRTYIFTPTITGSCHANTTNPSTTFDTIISIRTSPTGTDLACNDDNGMSMSPATASYIAWNATAFTSYYIVVDGYNGAVGTFTLTVACP